MFLPKISLTAILLITFHWGLSQQTILIDLKDNKATNEEKSSNLDSITFKVINCNGYSKIKIRIFRDKEKGDIRAHEVKCDSFKKIAFSEIIGKNDSQMEIDVETPNKKGEFSNAFRFYINTKGMIFEPDSNTSESLPGSPLPPSENTFVPRDFLFSKNSQAFNESCQYCSIEYDPCCNTYKIINNKGEEESFLRYRPLKKSVCNCQTKWLKPCGKEYACQGVKFKITNINTLKYDISVNSQFLNPYTNPNGSDLFNSLTTLVGGGEVGVLNKTNTEKEEKEGHLRQTLAEITALKTELENYLNSKLMAEDCISAEVLSENRQTIIDSIIAVFPADNGAISVVPTYMTAKTNFLKADPEIELEDFNMKIKARYRMSVARTL